MRPFRNRCPLIIELKGYERWLDPAEPSHLPIDLVPLWTLAVANIYRKSKQIAIAREGIREDCPVRGDPRST